MKRLTIAIASLAVASTLLVSCSAPPSTTTSSEGSSDRYAGDDEIALDDSGEGGTLTIGMTAAAIPTVNTPPSDAFEGRRFVGYQIYDGLLNWNLDQPDEAVTPSPGLATDWSVGDDGVTWTLAIREGVSFHDGSDLTAESIVFNLDRMLNPEFEYFDEQVSIDNGWTTHSVESYRAVDDYTLEIVTKEPYSILPWDMALWLIASPAVIEEYGNDGYEEHASGTGPFMIDVYNPGQELEMVPNENYWGTVPKLDRLVLRAMPSAGTRLAALQSGEIQWAEVPPPDAVGQLEDEGFNVLLKQYPHTIYFTPNPFEPSPVSDPLVLEAIQHAIDRDQMCEVLLSGLCAPAYQMAYEGHPWWNEEFGQTWSYDPERSQELLAEAGYEEGVEISIAFPASGSGNMWPTPMMELIQSNLAEVGITANLESMEWNTLSDLRGRTFVDPEVQEYDLIWGSSGVAVPANLTGLRSESIPPVGCCNTGAYDSAAYDAALEEATTEFDEEASNAAFAEALGILAADSQMVYVVHDLNLRALSPDVRGFIQPQSWFVDLTKAWVQE
jgi:peptide/nickel transport system substrate-binding protein